MTSFSLTGKSALVTGSSQGIGHALAVCIAQSGATVLFHGKEATAPAMPGGSSYFCEDLLDPSGPVRLMGAAFATAPGLSLLVCNAGGFFDVPFLELDPERFARTLNLNVRANYFIVQAFAQRLVAEGRPGAIVITSSTNGFQPEDDSSAYDTSKGAAVMMTRTLAQSLAKYRIRVNGLAPGLIRTPLTSGVTEGPRAAHYQKKILLGRIGVPEDCVGTVVFLLSEAAAYITGHIVTVDGGLTLGQIGKA